MFALLFDDLPDQQVWPDLQAASPFSCRRFHLFPKRTHNGFGVG
jgi:hypothetical protein